MKKTSILITSFLLITIILLSYNYYKPKNKTNVKFNEITINAEIANNQQETTKGLMNRQELGEFEGMLFIFEEEKQRSFWMKNTLIPLDMIFLDSNKKIVHIQENATPCLQDPCPLYPSQDPCQYVIEVNAGLTQEHNITIMETASFS